MQKKGKFVLFAMDEFDQWLQQTRFSRSVKLVQNHHTFQPAYAQFDGGNHFALLEGMEHFHMAERGFSEIAQNLTSFPDGTVALCRSIDKVPAGVKGANQEGICLENLGNFDAGGNAMTPAHRDAIVRINALLCREFNLTPSTDTIVFHHWYDLNSGQRTGGSGTTKSCPGSAFFGGNSVDSAAANFVPLVAQVLAVLTGGATPTPPQASGAADVVATSLNVRSGRGASFPIVKSLARGVRVNVFETAEGWCRIHPSEQQWVSARYLRFA
ncbi:amidase [Geobacter sp.]|uniref:amidase n=1 Tax=Geobacter sp. TaxID=46610 RepID=UPI002608CDA6|nr:amidase [Geobacter sp.]